MKALFLVLMFVTGCLPQMAVERYTGAAYICNQWDTVRHHGECYAPSVGMPPSYK
jgi:hypothetical protein